MLQYLKYNAFPMYAPSDMAAGAAAAPAAVPGNEIASGGGTADAPTPAAAEPADGVGGTDTEEDDGEDYEYEGEKYRLPKKLAQHVKTGTLAERDYRFKSGELATERRALEADRKAYQESLKTVQERLKAYEPARPDPAMLDPASEKYDRDTYYRQRDAWDAWDVKMKAANEAKAAEDKRTADDSSKAKRDRIAKENEALLNKVPEWKDSAKRAAETTKIGEFAAKELGVSPQEFSEIDDHRLLVALRESMMYRASLKAAQVDAKPIQTEPVKPLAVKKLNGGSAAGKDLSKMNVSEFIKARNAHEARLRKEGKRV